MYEKVLEQEGVVFTSLSQVKWREILTNLETLTVLVVFVAFTKRTEGYGLVFSDILKEDRERTAHVHVETR